MKYIIYILLLLSTKAFAQTSDTIPFVHSIDTLAFMREARKHFAKKIIEYKKLSTYEARIAKNTSVDDTSNIKHVIPVYLLRDIGKYDKLLDLIYFSPNSTNQFYTVYNGKDYWTGEIHLGIASYIEQLNKNSNDFVKFSINGNGCILCITTPKEITEHEQFCTFINTHTNWKFFFIYEIKDGVWAFDENNHFLHISQDYKKINIEDGEKYYKREIYEKGMNCIENLLAGGNYKICLRAETINTR